MIEPFTFNVVPLVTLYSNDSEEMKVIILLYSSYTQGTLLAVVPLGNKMCEVCHENVFLLNI